MVAQEIKHKGAKRSHDAKQQAVGNALFNLFITDTSEIEDGTKNALYCYLETILTTLAKKGTLDEVFSRSINRWTKLTSCLEAFTQRAPNSPCFLRSVANSVVSRKEKTAKTWRILVKAEADSPPEVGDPWHQPSSLSSSSYDEDRKKRVVLATRLEHQG